MATDYLILENLDFVKEIAKGYQDHGMEIDDLVSEGTLGLIEAARLYNPLKDASFKTYAYKRIHNAIRKALPKQGSKIKLPYYIHQKLISYLKFCSCFYSEHKREATIDDYYEAGYPKDSCLESALLASADTISLEDRINPFSDIKNENRSIFAISISDRTVRRILEEELESLLRPIMSERHYKILMCLYGFNGKKMSLNEIAENFDISPKFLRVLHDRIKFKIRNCNKANEIRECLQEIVTFDNEN